MIRTIDNNITLVNITVNSNIFEGFYSDKFIFIDVFKKLKAKTMIILDFDTNTTWTLDYSPMWFYQDYKNAPNPLKSFVTLLAVRNLNENKLENTLLLFDEPDYYENYYIT